MKRDKVRFIAGIILAAVVLFIAVAGLIFRLNKFKIVFSEKAGIIDTVECGSRYEEPQVEARLVGRIFYKSGKKIEYEKAGSVDSTKLGTYNIYWSAAAAGIKGSLMRTVDVVDTTPPVITLAPYPKMVVYLGEEYIEPGFTATDSVDGDITADVTVSKIDTSKLGEKTVKYTVSDKSGNSTSVTRKLMVKVKPVKKPADDKNEEVKSDKVIYLTFDDGPGRYTSHLLDVLAKYEVKATFFVTGGGDKTLIARAAKEGHSIGVHSFTHDYSKIYKSEAAFYADINKLNELIKEQTGSYTSLLRFPGGSSNTVSKHYKKGIMTALTKSVEKYGFMYFDWNVLSGDANGVKNTEKIYTNVINGIRGKPYSIVLQHDIKGFSVNAVEKIIKWGLNNDYTFERLTSDSPTVHQHVNN